MKTFLNLVSISIQSRLYYKTSFLIELISPLIQLAASFLLWIALYAQQGGNTIGMLPRSEMFSYILTAFALNNLMSFSTENMLSKEIRTGTVAARLVRPVPFLLQILSELTGAVILQLLVNTAVISAGFLLFGSFMKIPTAESVLLFIPCVILSILLRMMLIEISSLLCFYSTGYLGISWTRDALTNFFSGSLIPVALFPGLLRRISYLTPFPYMLQVPVSVLLGQELPAGLPVLFLIQTAWIVIFLGIHCTVFSRIRRNMNIAGG